MLRCVASSASECFPAGSAVTRSTNSAEGWCARRWALEWGGELRLSARALQVDHEASGDVACQFGAVVVFDEGQR